MYVFEEEKGEFSLLYLMLKTLGMCPPLHADCDQSMVMLVLLISKAVGRLGRGGEPVQKINQMYAILIMHACTNYFLQFSRG